MNWWWCDIFSFSSAETVTVCLLLSCCTEHYKYNNDRLGSVCTYNRWDWFDIKNASMLCEFPKFNWKSLSRSIFIEILRLLKCSRPIWIIRSYKYLYGRCLIWHLTFSLIYNHPTFSSVWARLVLHKILKFNYKYNQFGHNSNLQTVWHRQ